MKKIILYIIAISIIQFFRITGMVFMFAIGIIFVALNTIELWFEDIQTKLHNITNKDIKKIINIKKEIKPKPRQIVEDKPEIKSAVETNDIIGKTQTSFIDELPELIKKQPVNSEPLEEEQENIIPDLPDIPLTIVNIEQEGCII